MLMSGLGLSRVVVRIKRRAMMGRGATAVFERRFGGLGRIRMSGQGKCSLKSKADFGVGSGVCGFRFTLASCLIYG